MEANLALVELVHTWADRKNVTLALPAAGELDRYTFRSARFTPSGTEPAQAGIPFSPASQGRSRAGGPALIP
ncbi:MAG: hypothetical protein HY735_00205 [Verrucomicrobia bacterium]|nr:hypothetical protein [Verrucomicrobiota bacterium]